MPTKIPGCRSGGFANPENLKAKLLIRYSIETHPHEKVKGVWAARMISSIRWS